mmetsp:Transcript_12854/g.45006  ORF Transcript_12854/g.45006 Transcript_12854/m.45006 type:complete len:404 (+) Transcript_12854:208-1419(+)
MAPVAAAPAVDAGGVVVIVVAIVVLLVTMTAVAVAMVFAVTVAFAMPARCGSSRRRQRLAGSPNATRLAVALAVSCAPRAAAEGADSIRRMVHGADGAEHRQRLDQAVVQALGRQRNLGLLLATLATLRAASLLVCWRNATRAAAHRRHGSECRVLERPSTRRRDVVARAPAAVRSRRRGQGRRCNCLDGQRGRRRGGLGRGGRGSARRHRRGARRRAIVFVAVCVRRLLNAAQLGEAGHRRQPRARTCCSARRPRLLGSRSRGSELLGGLGGLGLHGGDAVLLRLDLLALQAEADLGLQVRRRRHALAGPGVNVARRHVRPWRRRRRQPAVRALVAAAVPAKRDARPFGPCAQQLVVVGARDGERIPGVVVRVVRVVLPRRTHSRLGRTSTSRARRSSSGSA